MKDVEFHTGVVDPTDFACRLLRKVHRQGARVQVTAPPALLDELDRQLWTFDEREFLPHVRLPAAPAALHARTPIWLTAAVTTQPGAPRLLLNLGADAPEDLQALDRLIEVLSTDETAVQAGRARWRAYKAAGLNVVHHSGAERRA